MPSEIHIYKNLAWLNALPADEAEAVFLACCGSTEWARLMAGARPFAMLEHLFRAADEIWFSLPSADHLEAFAAHQAKVEKADDETLKALAKANRLYARRFGFIFIVSASGKTPDEMLAICRARLGNSVETELRLAAEEQRKITEIKLSSLLEKE